MAASVTALLAQVRQRYVPYQVGKTRNPLQRSSPQPITCPTLRSSILSKFDSLGPNIDPSSCSILKKENSRTITRSTNRVLHLDLVNGQVVPSFHKQRPPISLSLRHYSASIHYVVFHLHPSTSHPHLLSSDTALPKTESSLLDFSLFAQVRWLINRSVTIASPPILVKLRG